MRARACDGAPLLEGLRHRRAPRAWHPPADRRTWLQEFGIAQAIRVLEVSSFGPFLVESDLAGNSLFEGQNRTINTRIEQLYADLKSPSLRRYDETTSREDEVI